MLRRPSKAILEKQEQKKELKIKRVNEVEVNLKAVETSMADFWISEFQRVFRRPCCLSMQERSIVKRVSDFVGKDFSVICVALFEEWDDFRRQNKFINDHFPSIGMFSHFRKNVQDWYYSRNVSNGQEFNFIDPKINEVNLIKSRELDLREKILVKAETQFAEEYKAFLLYKSRELDNIRKEYNLIESIKQKRKIGERNEC